MKNIGVLIVDDSVLMRRILSDIISSAGGMEVVGTARNGIEGVRKTAELNPDVVLMDIEMPEMDGLTALTQIMEETPTPVVMVSALDAKDADIVLQSLDKGAVDFVSKPQGRSITVFDNEDSKRLIEVVKSAAFANISPSKPVKRVKEELEIKEESTPPLIVIGASTGGPKTIKDLLSNLPDNIHAYILIVQHMPPGFTKSFADRLGPLTGFHVVEAKDREPLAIGKVIVAQGDNHMVIEKLGLKSYTVRLDKGPKVNAVRPSVDVTMESAAEVFGSNIIAILLTGMGSDGAIGMSKIKKKGGKTIAEDKSSCVINGMPKAAISLGAADYVTPLHEIPLQIMNLMT
ncbi:chemotaxis response regulator protein-glutamate methylesterase [archaeon]|nr:chemotaxis response regulator protein-glutamate methylesterase [archaeon]